MNANETTIVTLCPLLLPPSPLPSHPKLIDGWRVVGPKFANKILPLGTLHYLTGFLNGLVLAAETLVGWICSVPVLVS